MAHKCNMRQLFAIPASYENNITIAKPEGRYAHARIDPLLRLPHFLASAQTKHSKGGEEGRVFGEPR